MAHIKVSLDTVAVAGADVGQNSGQAGAEE
jgi:hypothetical protein